MMVFITKYALTRGIMRFDVERINIEKHYVVVKNSRGFTTMFFRNDWHRTKQDALDRVEQMREAKLKSLKKSIERISQMKFQLPEQDGWV